MTFPKEKNHGIFPVTPKDMGPLSYKLPIPFPYSKGFLWEWYGSGMGVVWEWGYHYWGSLEFPLKNFHGFGGEGSVWVRGGFGFWAGFDT